MKIEAICVDRDMTIRGALSRIEQSGVGILLVVTAGVFERTVTDGDLRRLILSGCSLEHTLVELADVKSVTVEETYTRREALSLMRKHKINHLPVVSREGHVLDLVLRSSLDEHVLLSTPHIGEEELEYVNEAFRTNWIAPLGPNVDAFEREVASKVGSPNAVALSSGTAAIHLALILLDVGPDDIVFCSSLTFVASVNPVLYQGAEPVFIDSEPNSWNMSPVALERAFVLAAQEGRMPKAVIVVSLYGQSADMDSIIEICEKYSVPIVEDAAESLGAMYKGKCSGTFGRFGIYSFNGNKIITTSGGGMLLMEDESSAKRARFLATQARDPALHYQHSSIGYNYRLSNVLAGVGRGQLKVLDQRVAARRKVFATYKSELSSVDWLEWMPVPDWSFSTHWLSACKIRDNYKNRKASEIIAKLSEDFIEARPIWKPMHLQPLFRKHQYHSHGEQSVSDDLFEQGICLPSGSNMTESQQSRVIDAILAI